MRGYIITWELRSDRILVAVKECGRARHGGLWSVSLDDHLLLFGNQGAQYRPGAFRGRLLVARRRDQRVRTFDGAIA